MQTVLAVILAAAAAYLLGQRQFCSLVVSKGLYHQDVRQFGSWMLG